MIVRSPYSKPVLPLLLHPPLSNLSPRERLTRTLPEVRCNLIVAEPMSQTENSSLPLRFQVVWTLNTSPTTSLTNLEEVSTSPRSSGRPQPLPLALPKPLTSTSSQALVAVKHKSLSEDPPLTLFGDSNLTHLSPTLSTSTPERRLPAPASGSLPAPLVLPLLSLSLTSQATKVSGSLTHTHKTSGTTMLTPSQASTPSALSTEKTATVTKPSSPPPALLLLCTTRELPLRPKPSPLPTTLVS